MSSLTRIAAPVLRRSLSTSAPRARKLEDLSPEIRTKFDQLQKNQEFFQREDGNYVHNKKPMDRVQLGVIIFATVAGLIYNAKFAYDKYNGKY